MKTKRREIGRVSSRNESGWRFLCYGACLFFLAAGLGGCTHGADDTGGGSSAGSMSGTTGMQGTQEMANRQGPPAGGASKTSER